MGFRSLWKLSMMTLGALRLSGNEFQADGPATEKASRPYVCRAEVKEESEVVDWRT